MSTDAAGVTSDSIADTRRVVQERLDACRRDLYGGRGPGIPEEEWLRNSSLRGSVGGIPTAVSRENLRLRTRRIRGESVEKLNAEAKWAAAQFPTERSEFDALASPPRRRRASAARIVALGLLGTAIWRSLRARAVKSRRRG